MSVEITEENFNFSDIIEKSDLSFDTKRKLSKSKIILLPESFLNSHERGDFPSDTPDLLKFIRRTNPEFEPGVFENVGEEKFLEQNAAVILLPSFFINIQDIAIQIITGLITSYIYEKLRNTPNPENTTVNTEIFLEELTNRTTIHIKYSGPVAELKNIEKIVMRKKDE